MRSSLSIAEARRIALTAQGFDKARPANATRRHVRQVIDRLGLLQLDFVNVLVPAHYFVPFSRIGAYHRIHLDHWAYRSGAFTEQWAHEACILPMDAWPLLRHRRDRERWVHHLTAQHEDYGAWVIEQIRERGALAGEDLPGPDGGRGRIEGSWYKSIQRVILEAHFGRGVLGVARRLPNFARVYDLAERVVEAEHHAKMHTPEDAKRELLARSARAHGVGTLADFADYYRMKMPDARRHLPELLERGDIREVAVEGWKEKAYLHRDAKLPRAIEARALLSPFDPVVWFRPRAERLFGFEYRIEIYTPAHKRRYGYYVLPFLLGDQIVARVDLKADRAAGQLKALSTHYEKGVNKKTAAASLSEELAAVADWLGLDYSATTGLRKSPMPSTVITQSSPARK
ncbi:MAG: crosslink repair DNA glycosylase YcaQ family protein [Verrucomicrobiota bacterium]